MEVTVEFKEVKLLYAAVSNNDNRRLDESVAAEWHRSIERNLGDRATLPDCLAVVEEWFDVSRGEYFTKGIFLDLMRKRLRLNPKAVSDDVRSAKARGLISADWDTSTAIPADVAQRLAQARAEARDIAPGEVESGPSKLRLEAGRRVP